jgi:Peptidase family M50
MLCLSDRAVAADWRRDPKRRHAANKRPQPNRHSTLTWSRRGSAKDMEQTCTGCGYRSANRSFFRQERSGVFGRRKAFCHGCAPYRPTQRENLSVHWMWMLVIGALLVASGLEGLPRAIGYLWVFSGAMGLCGVVSVIAHELGHAVAARMVGMKVVRVVVGSGPILVAREWQDIRFELRRYVLASGLTFAYHQIESPKKWREMAMLLGGVWANLLLLVLGTCILVVLIARFALSDPFVIAVAFGALAWQILAIIANLWPRKLHRGQLVRANDGRLLFDLLRAKDFPRQVQEDRLYWRGMAHLQGGRYAAAQVHFEQAHRLLPTSGRFLLAPRAISEQGCGPACCLGLLPSTPRRIRQRE